MEVYILDSLYRRVQVVDRYESFVWTERFKAYGDFSLHLHSTLENRSRFLTGTRIATNESLRVMTVETVEDVTDNEGVALIKLTGRSLEGILEERVARAALEDLTTTPKWVLEGKPVEIAEKIFHDICVTGVLDPGDVIMGVIEGDDIFPLDTNAEPSEEISYAIDPMTVYKAIKDLCDVYDIGFRLVRNFDTSQLYWDVYTGSDRTTYQSTLPAVVFGPNLENMVNTREIKSIALYKNVAYVFSPVGYEVVYSPLVDPTTSGFDRRVLLIDASDIDETDPLLASAMMIQRGKEELAKNRRYAGFDGELSNRNSYKYGTDYNLGDLVELQNVDGVTTVMQVVEQIFVSDKEGEKSYPTLALPQFITIGTWSTWDYNQKWNELTTEEWKDQP